MTSTLAGLLFVENIYDEANVGMQSSQGGNYSFDWCGAKGEFEIDKSVIDDGTGIMMKSDHFLVEGVRLLLLRKWR